MIVMTAVLIALLQIIIQNVSTVKMHQLLLSHKILQQGIIILFYWATAHAKLLLLVFVSLNVRPVLLISIIMPVLPVMLAMHFYPMLF